MILEIRRDSGDFGDSKDSQDSILTVLRIRRIQRILIYHWMLRILKRRFRRLGILKIGDSEDCGFPKDSDGSEDSKKSIDSADFEKRIQKIRILKIGDSEDLGF